MTKAKLISEADVEKLQEAGEDVSYLTLQGWHPTDAVAKVASAAKLTKDQTRLLICAYSAGVAAEKRASSGGPFSRLAEYDLPDPDKVMKKVYGKKSDTTRKEAVQIFFPEHTSKEITKTASAPLVFDLRNLDRDLSGMTEEEVRDLFYPGTKTAEDDNEESAFERSRKPGSGVSIARISVSVLPPSKEEDCEADDDYVHSIPTTIEEAMKAGLKPMSPELNQMIDSVLKDMLKKAAAEKTALFGAADLAYTVLGSKVMEFGNRLQRPWEDVAYKAAGLASVNAYYPGVADVMAPFVGEVLAYSLKTAQYNLLDLSKSHEFVQIAKDIQDQIEKTAEITLQANRAKEYYDEVEDLYKNRPRGEKADWMKIAMPWLFPAGVWASLANTAAKTTKNVVDVGAGRINAYKSVLGSPVLTGTDPKPLYSDSQKRKSIEDSAEVQKQLGDLASLQPLLISKNTATMSMLNDFKLNDEILKAYPTYDLVNAYNELAKAVPHTMRNPILARSMMQTYMTQGRIALPELEPAMKMDSTLSQRYGVLTGASGRGEMKGASSDDGYWTTYYGLEGPPAEEGTSKDWQTDTPNADGWTSGDNSYGHNQRTWWDDTLGYVGGVGAPAATAAAGSAGGAALGSGLVRGANVAAHGIDRISQDSRIRDAQIAERNRVFDLLKRPKDISPADLRNYPMLDGPANVQAKALLQEAFRSGEGHTAPKVKPGIAGRTKGFFFGRPLDTGSRSPLAQAGEAFSKGDVKPLMDVVRKASPTVVPSGSPLAQAARHSTNVRNTENLLNQIGTSANEIGRQKIVPPGVKPAPKFKVSKGGARGAALGLLATLGAMGYNAWNSRGK